MNVCAILNILRKYLIIYFQNKYNEYLLKIEESLSDNLEYYMIYEENI